MANKAKNVQTKMSTLDNYYYKWGHFCHNNLILNKIERNGLEEGKKSSLRKEIE